MAFFTSPDGVRLHYEIEGSGPPLIFHLGAGCDADVWRAAGYVEPLSKAYSCVLFDHRGHGKSDHPTSVEANHLDRYAGDLVALVRHLGGSTASFFGWSNGLLVGMRAIDEHPEIFDSLVLFGGIAPPRTREELAARAPVIAEGLRTKGWRLLLDDMEAAEPIPVPRWFTERVEATDIEPYIAWSLARPEWSWSPWEAFPRVQAPAQFLAGELEDPDDLCGQAAVAMPHAQRIRIPGREHINAFLYSEFVVPRVLEFLATSARQATG